MRRSALLLLLLLLGCQPLYLPPIPQPLEAPRRFELTGNALVAGGRPVLELQLRTVPNEAWLAVQWFSPADGEVASESVWTTPADQGRSISLELPADVEAVAGRWRAVLSRDDMVVRQLSVVVPADAD